MTAREKIMQKFVLINLTYISIQRFNFKLLMVLLPKCL